jgi:hypothetical protein
MFQVFQVFHTSVVSVSFRCCICLQWVSSVFRHFRKCFRRLYQVFYMSSLYIVTVASRCFKSKSEVVLRMHVESGRRCGRHLWQRAWVTSGVGVARHWGARSLAACAGFFSCVSVLSERWRLGTDVRALASPHFVCSVLLLRYPIQPSSPKCTHSAHQSPIYHSPLI